MKRIGIDYGQQNVGIAVSDEDGTMAFAKVTIPNNPQLIDHITSIIKDEGIEEVVLGESLDFKKAENPIMKKVHAFKEKLAQQTDIPVVFEPELFSTQEARRGQEGVRIVDASAAAIILQSYLDKQQ